MLNTRMRRVLVACGAAHTDALRGRERARRTLMPRASLAAAMSRALGREWRAAAGFTCGLDLGDVGVGFADREHGERARLLEHGRKVAAGVDEARDVDVAFIE